MLELFEAGGLPAPVKQQVVVQRDRLMRIDFHVPGTALMVEADGYASHSDEEAFEGDRDRDNRLGANGFIVQRWTWRALHERPHELIENARRIISMGPRPTELAWAAL